MALTVTAFRLASVNEMVTLEGVGDFGVGSGMPR